MKKSLLLLPLFIIVLFSCATMNVPVPESDSDTQLVIRVKTDTVDNIGYFASYKVLLDNGESIRLTPNEGYLHVRNLPPGTYRIIGWQAYYKKTGKYSVKTKLNIPFTLEPRTITILNSIFHVEIRKHPQKEGYYSQYLNVGTMGSIHREEARAYLAGFENIGYWKIRDN